MSGTATRPTSESGDPSSDGSGRVRAFKACLNCRERKVKCNLGELNNPRPPPCDKCRREGIDCEFAPSQRGGRTPANAGKRKRDPSEPGDSFYVERSPSMPPPSRKPRQAEEGRAPPPPPSTSAERIPPLPSAPSGITPPQISAMGHIGSLSSNADGRLPDYSSPPFEKNELGRSANIDEVTVILPPPLASGDIFPYTQAVASDAGSSRKSPAVAGSQSNPPRMQRRADSSRALAAAELRNPSDAIELLSQESSAEASARGTSQNTFPASAVGWRRSASNLADFALVQTGVMSGKKCCELISEFFTRCHFMLPVVPSTKVPRTERDVAIFASEEPHLATAFCVIASRHDRQPAVHDKCWAYMQTLINDINVGKSAPVGAVEALLLLSEFLPRLPNTTPAQLGMEENRCSWMLVGSAVRLACMLGLDQRLPVSSSAPLADSYSREEELLFRERVAWTYCYIYDRQISARTGKTSNTLAHSVSFGGRAEAARDFPMLRFIPQVQDDFASLIKAYLELTQIMSATHNVLYTSRQQTTQSQEGREYSKHVDEFSRSLEGFRKTWDQKRWATYPLTECVWITFHYARLHIHGFAFHAHLQRAMKQASAQSDEPPDFFPAGIMASPDADSILEAIDAAADLLRLVTDRLFSGGALPYLPRRYYLYFCYACVFLLKAVHFEAVGPHTQITIVRLVRRLIFVLACASLDDQHPGTKFALMLNKLLHTFLPNFGSAGASREVSPDGERSAQMATNQHPLDGAGPSLQLSSDPADLAATFPLRPFTPSQPFHQILTTLEEAPPTQLDLGELDLQLEPFDWPTGVDGNLNYIMDTGFWNSLGGSDLLGMDWSAGLNPGPL